MHDLKQQSPLGRYLEHLGSGELAYQYSPSDAKAVFYPRLVAPGSGAGHLEWRVSNGLGTVHSTTWIPVRDGEPYNVALVDVDEGFRMMTRIEDIDPKQVRIGMRVRFRVRAGEKPDDPPYAVFVPAEGA